MFSCWLLTGPSYVALPWSSAIFVSPFLMLESSAAATDQDPGMQRLKCRRAMCVGWVTAGERGLHNSRMKILLVYLACFNFGNHSWVSQGSAAHVSCDVAECRRDTVGSRLGIDLVVCPPASDLLALQR